MISICCDHYKNGRCSLGLHGGNPYKQNCDKCISHNENNKEYADKLFAAYAKSHPEGIARISGCCDRADQA